MKFGIFSHTHPTAKAEGKYFHADQDGTLQKGFVGALTMCNYTTCQVPDLATLAAWMRDDALPTQYLTSGIAAHETALVVSREDRPRYNGIDPDTDRAVITRSGDDITLPDGEGLMPIDSDGLTEADDVCGALCKVVPALGMYSRIETTSSSSNVVLNDTSTGRKGTHTFLRVANAGDIPRALNDLHVWLWLAGFGKYLITSDGRFKPKSYVDSALKTPSQPVYIRAHVTPPVTQHKDVQLHVGMLEVLDTAAVIPAPSEADLKRYDALVEEMKERTKPEQEAQRHIWKQSRVGFLVDEKGMTEADATTLVDSMVDSQFLMREWPVRVGRSEWTTVGEILDNPKAWHKKRCYDPIEGETYGSISTAKIYSDQDRPLIASKAHGGDDDGNPVKYWMLNMPAIGGALPEGAQPVVPVAVQLPHVPQQNDAGSSQQMQASDNFFVNVSRSVYGVTAWNLPDVKMTNGRPPAPKAAQTASPANMTFIMQSVGAQKWLNMMTQDDEWVFNGALGEVIDTHGANVSELAVPILKQFAVNCDIAPESAERALMDVCSLKYHPMEDWLKSLPPWDGVDRLQAIADGLPSPNPQDYLRAVIKRWFIQGVQAVCGWRDPKQMPHVLCFSGPQGALKTSWVLSCAPPQFTTEGVTLSITGDPTKDRDSIRAASRTPIVELGELEASFSKSNTEANKNYLSRTHDTYRLAFGRREVTYPRCTIYAGTLNGTAFLHDETGSRRYWPIQITDQLTLIAEADLQQVWAQALHLWQSGESWFLNDSERAMHAQIVEHHTEGDTIDDLLEEAFPDGFWTRPAGQDAGAEDPNYELLNLTEIAKRIKLERPNSRDRRLIRHWVEKHGGVRGQYEPHASHRDANGKRNSRRKNVFMAKTTMPDHLKNKLNPTIPPAPPPLPNGQSNGQSNET